MPQMINVIRAIAAALLMLAWVAPAAANERYAGIVMDARTGEVLYEDHADARRYPASLAKMMTLYMLFEAIERGELDWNTRLTASRNASRQPPTRLGLRPGDSITVDQAVRALIVQSANDVATMVAERLGGSETRFAASMTARARELGLRHTRFANASGLPDRRHRTTARDMALLSQALWNDFAAHYHLFATPRFDWRNSHGRNHNRLLGRVEGVDGIKTGYTRASGFNLATMAERDGRRIIVIVMGGRTAASRNAHVADLIERSYRIYAERDDQPPTRLVSAPARRAESGRVVETAAPLGAAIDPVGEGAHTQ